MLPDLTILGKIVGGGLPRGGVRRSRRRDGAARAGRRRLPGGDARPGTRSRPRPGLRFCAGCATRRSTRSWRRRARGWKRACAVRPRPARRCDGDALPPRRRRAHLRGREGERHRALRRPLPPPARARHLRRRRPSSSASSSRSPTPTRTSTAPSRPLATSSATDVFETIAAEAAAESPLWGEALRGDPERVPVFGALVPERFALGVETIYEGYLLHYGRPRLFAPPDEDVALLLGDYLYAHGLVRIAATGDARRRRRACGADLGVRRPPRGGRVRRRRRLGRLRPPARRRSRRGEGRRTLSARMPIALVKLGP